MSEITEFKNIIQTNKERHKMRETKIEIDFLLSLLEKAERYERVLKQIAYHDLISQGEGADCEGNELIYMAQEALEDC